MARILRRKSWCRASAKKKRWNLKHKRKAVNNMRRKACGTSKKYFTCPGGKRKAHCRRLGRGYNKFDQIKY